MICRFLFPFYLSQTLYFNLLPSLSLLFHLALKIIKAKTHFSQLCGTKVLGKILCIDCKIYTPNAPQVLTCLPCPELEPSYLLPTTSLVQKIPTSLKTLHWLSNFSFTVLKLRGFSDSFKWKFKQRLEFTTAIVSKWKSTVGIWENPTWNKWKTDVFCYLENWKKKSDLFFPFTTISSYGTGQQ